MKCLKIKSVLAVLLCGVMLCTTFILPINTVFAESVNIISGSCPVVYGSSDKDSYEFNGNKVRFAATGKDKLEYGYDETDITTKQFWSEKLSALTDGDNNTGIYIRPEKTSDRVIMVYRFAAHTLKTLKLKFNANVKKNVLVFAVKNKSDLYKNEPLYTLDGGFSENDFEIPLNNVDACYLALVFEGAKYNVVEAELLGTKIDEGESILKGMIPTMYAPAYEGQFTYNWHQIHYGADTSEKLYGYSEEELGYKEGWKEHTAKLTDADTETGLYIKPEAQSDSKRVVVVYSLSDIYTLNGFYLKSDSSVKSYSVYIGTSRSNLFKDNPAYQLENSASVEQTDSFGGVKAKYIGIVFESPDFTVNEISVYGEKYEPKESIVAGSIPTMYSPAYEGQFTYNWRQIHYGTNTSEKMYGYSEEYSGTQESWKEHTVKLTDGNADTGLYIRPENAGSSKRVIVVYKFSNSYLLSGLDIKADSSEKTYSVYVSIDRNTLFDGEPFCEVSKDISNELFNDLGGKKANYIGIVFESPNLTVNEILVYGEKFVPENNGSIIFNSNPTMYSPAYEGQFTYNWRQIQYGTNTAAKLYGYSEDVPGSKELWNEHTARLTDGDTDTGLYIKPENAGNSKRVIIVYDFGDLYNLSELNIVSDTSSKAYSVYVSTIRSSLFEGDPVCEVKSNTLLNSTNDLNGVRAKYIGIVFESPNLTVSEISVFGELFVPPAKEKGENTLLGKTPAMYASARAGTYTYNWTMTAYESNGSHYQGYTENDRITQKEFWDTYTANYTDGNEETATYIAPEQRGGWVIVVYNIEDSIVNGFTIKTNSTENKAVQFFASSDRSSLFQNLVYEVECSKKDIVDDGSIDIRAKYVGFAFQNPSYDITEIIVNADEYVRTDYGTSLLEGKLPTTLYVADREYPLIPNGVEFLDIEGTSKKLTYLTDNDFTTASVWTPWYSLQYPTKDSAYIVTAFDIGDMATLDTFRIDSGLGGFDIYVSDNFLDVFESKDNIVYSSEGDKLTEDQSSLDPSTDLATGEQVISLGGVRGRFIGLVITRTAPSTVENWGNASISEIQLFGTLDSNSHGENLVFGTDPVAIYRANYDDYALSQGTMTSQAGTAAYTDGKSSISAIQFPNAGGYINYDNGLVVMIYYLQGNCDIKRVNIKSTFYYGIGGVDIYTSDSYGELFESSNRIFTTEGYEVTDGIYEASKNLGSLQIPAYFDNAVSGRYIAFAFTRISDSNSRGWGLLRLDEIEVFGTRSKKEVLPNTTVTDSKTGSTATFNYQNPDEKSEFAKKGIASFRIVSDNSCSDDLFNQILISNGYTAVREPFRIEFLDKKGNVISSDRLAGENVTFNFKLDNNKFCFLSEFIKGGASVIKFAAYKDGYITYDTDNFDRTYVLLKFNSAGPLSNNVSKGGTLYEGTIEGSDDFFTEWNDTENVTDSETDNIQDKNQTGGRKWVVVEYDDPLEWFWNIYDTFAANIWMLIVCCGMLILGIDAVIFGIAYYIKRRKRV